MAVPVVRPVNWIVASRKASGCAASRAAASSKEISAASTRDSVGPIGINPESCRLPGPSSDGDGNVTPERLITMGSKATSMSHAPSAGAAPLPRPEIEIWTLTVEPTLTLEAPNDTRVIVTASAARGAPATNAAPNRSITTSEQDRIRHVSGIGTPR
jgi:hypothetical protein